MVAQVNVDKLQHSIIPTVIGLEITNAGTNFYLNPISGPLVTADIESSTGVGIPGRVQLGGSVSPQSTTSHGSFVSKGRGFRIDGGCVREKAYYRNTNPASSNTYYLDEGGSHIFSSAPSGNYTINITNSASSTATNQNLNDRMQTGHATMCMVAFPVNSSSGTLTNLYIDGVDKTSTIEWVNQDNPLPGNGDMTGPGGTSGYDHFSFYIEKTGSGTWLIISTFGHSD